jgi:cysteine desulfurase/selenocysteine lyase
MNAGTTATDPHATGTASPLDVAAVRAQFPILHQEVHGRPLVYLDSAATAQKPQAVIDAVADYYRHDNANVHRGVHTLSQRATAAFEAARESVRRFLGARETRELIWTRGATESINLVANSWGSANVKEGDEILITWMEHHSNIVPWQMLCERTGARLVVAPIDDDGCLVMEEFERLLSERTRLVGCIHVSNSLGTVNPVSDVIRLAHEAGARVLIDGAQAAPHLPLDVAALDADFYVFAGHKTYGPTGIGALYGKAELLEAMPPWQGGGDMILSVSFEGTTYNELPHKFEAGTPNIAGAVGLGAALEWMTATGREAMAAHEAHLLAYAGERLGEIPGLRIIGNAPRKAGAHSFVLDGIHPHDIGTIMDHEGVGVRTGHHCTQPVMERFGIPATARASFAAYNTTEDVDRLVEAIVRVQEMFA